MAEGEENLKGKNTPNPKADGQVVIDDITGEVVSKKPEANSVSTNSNPGQVVTEDESGRPVASTSHPLTTPYKHTRLHPDGTTIVFFDTSEKLIYNIPLKENRAQKFLIEEANENNVMPANKEMRAAFKDSCKRIEDIANIRFFDINDLSSTDKKYLGDLIPKYPDVILRTVKKEVADRDGYSGMAYFNDGSATIQSINIAEDSTNKITGFLTFLMNHENGHSNGLRHTQSAKGNYFGVLSPEKDNFRHTVMSYNDDEGYKNYNFPLTFGDEDIIAFQQLYGPSQKGENYYKDHIKKQRDLVFEKSIREDGPVLPYLIAAEVQKSQIRFENGKFGRAVDKALDFLESVGKNIKGQKEEIDNITQNPDGNQLKANKKQLQASDDNKLPDR